MSTQRREQVVSCNAPLYRFVFRGKFSFTTVFVLCAAFMFSNIHLAFADEEGTSESSVQSVGEVEEFVAENAVSEEIAPAEETPIEAVETNEEVSVPVEVPVDEVVTPAEEAAVAVPADTEPVVDDGTTPADETLLTEDTSPESPSETENAATDNADLSEPSATTGTSTTETVPVQVDTLTNADNFYQFSRDECVRVADGSFYCGDMKEAQEPVIQNDLFAAPDSDGDLEIFLRFDGVESQITHNTEDDAAPYYDARSNTIVWHRLIDDRYQVISYDIDSGNEEQLTHGNENSMEPSRYDEITAWQSWESNNWEIVLFNGSKTTRLTTSPAHDVAPLVYEGYVIWNTTSADGEQQIAMYDLETKETTFINDADGASVQNPRMVLVYETANENGDVMTKGFDLESKTMVPLTATHREVPSEIPDSDQTGETRALIQNKSTSKESELMDLSPEPTASSAGSSTPPNLDAMASSTATVGTAASSTSNTVFSTSTVETVSTDVVIPAYVAATSTQSLPDLGAIIEDVVIPPFSATTS